MYGLRVVGRREESFIPGVEILAPEYGPCIVCGHPTGDCTPEDHTIIFKDHEEEDTILVEEDIIERRWLAPNQPF
jgi:hypothetical protein